MKYVFRLSWLRACLRLPALGTQATPPRHWLASPEETNRGGFWTLILRRYAG